VIPTFQGRRGHPVLMSEAHRIALLALGDEAPLHDYIRARSGACAHVAVDNPGVIAGMNTDVEYRSALAEIRKRRAGERRA
jgi:CTP:molybdopterin cytidylyltransferase MocA